MQRHSTTHVRVGTLAADIDEGLAPLIEGLWRLGIATSFSCEGSTATGPDAPPLDEPWGYIVFPDVEEFRKFLELFSHTALSQRRFVSAPENRTPTNVRWKRNVYVKRCGPNDTADERDGVRLPARLGFPSADIAEMTRVVLTKADAGSGPATLNYSAATATRT